MKYKVGDRVKIKSLDWYNENNDGSGILSYKISGIPFTSEMAKYCGGIVTINRAYAERNSSLGDRYYIKEDDGNWVWHANMIEGLAEDDNPFDDNIPLPDSFVERIVHKIADSELFNAEPLDIPTMTTDFVKEHGLPCPDGYEFRDENDNVIEAKKIVLWKKKVEWPKTYEECSKIVNGYRCKGNAGWRSLLLIKLQELLICRDAYWKIAGEEMKLGKPWSPSDTDYITGRYCIFVYRGNIICDTPAQDCILTFPTEEMRDVFYENFKDLIEECKELL